MLRLLDLRPRRVVLAVVLAAVQVMGSLGADAGSREPVGGSGKRGWSEWARWQAERERLDWIAVLLLLLGPAALLLRRRQLTSAGIAVGAGAVYLAAGYVVGPVLLSAGVALVLAVGAGRRVQAWAVAAGGWVLTVAGSQLGAHPLPLTSGLGFVVWIVAFLAIADVVHGRRERARAETRAREEERRRQVSEERLAIARDLHDGVAHHISLISVRAGVALHLLEANDPGAAEQAREALSTIRGASSEALAELRSALGALRADGEAAPRHPVPGLVAGAPALVRRWRDAGLAVVLEGMPESLPGAVDQALYRVLQEALTNVSRHSRAAQVTVRWERFEGGGRLTVRDPGPRRTTTAGPDGVPGRGLLGMRERIAQLGGTFSARELGDGWEVRAELTEEVLA